MAYQKSRGLGQHAEQGGPAHGAAQHWGVAHTVVLAVLGIALAAGVAARLRVR